MAKRQPAKQQPLKQDRCAVAGCNKGFGDSSTKKYTYGQAAVYIATRDVWVHAGACHTKWKNFIAWEQQRGEALEND